MGRRQSVRRIQADAPPEQTKEVDEFFLTDIEVSQIRCADLLRQNLAKTVQLAELELRQVQLTTADTIAKRTGIPVERVVSAYSFDVGSKMARLIPVAQTV